MKLLFDASSLLYALKLGNLEILKENYTQWLAVYESINALWKEVLTKNLEREEALQIISILSNTLEFMNILNPQKLEEEIFKEAEARRTSAYDASYVLLARKHGLILVTEDKDLRKKALETVETLSLNEASKHDLQDVY